MHPKNVKMESYGGRVINTFQPYNALQMTLNFTEDMTTYIHALIKHVPRNITIGSGLT